MALREIRVLGDPILEKKCKEVKEMTPRLRELIDDMLETMYDASGVGLAAPQVGILRRIAVVDVTPPEDEFAEDEEMLEGEEAEAENGEQDQAEDDGEEEEEFEEVPMPLVLINPVILESDGEQTDSEGCLSVPNKAGKVTRPMHIRVQAMDENMEPYEIEAEGFLARAICHEMDHLDGIVYVSKVEGDLYEVGSREEDEE